MLLPWQCPRARSKVFTGFNVGPQIVCSSPLFPGSQPGEQLQPSHLSSSAATPEPELGDHAAATRSISGCSSNADLLRPTTICSRSAQKISSKPSTCIPVLSRGHPLRHQEEGTASASLPDTQGTATWEMPPQPLSCPRLARFPGELEGPTQLGRGKEESKNTQPALPSKRR